MLWRTLISGLIVLLTLPALGWQQELQAVRELSDRGQYVTARQQLQTLREEHPDVGVLQLELAVVHLALSDFTAARAAVEAVLDRTDLPEAVRVNAQMLALSIEQQADRFQTRQRRLRADVLIGAEAGPDWYWVGLDVDASQRRRYRPLGLLGYPVRLLSQFSLEVGSRAYVDDFSAPFHYLEGRAGGWVSWRALSLGPAVGWRLTADSHGPVLVLDSEVALTDGLALSADSRWVGWQDDGGATARAAAGVLWRPAPAWESRLQRGWSVPGYELDTRADWRLTASWQPGSRPLGIEHLEAGIWWPDDDQWYPPSLNTDLRWRAGSSRLRLLSGLRLPLDGTTPGGQLGLRWQY
ncbi:tetratricopeptide repeat protein [Natronospirillum operosum]|nr:tetratricopeptide repeat protein [Natronospirillum operosum]